MRKLRRKFVCVGLISLTVSLKNMKNFSPIYTFILFVYAFVLVSFYFWVGHDLPNSERPLDATDIGVPSVVENRDEPTAMMWQQAPPLETDISTSTHIDETEKVEDHQREESEVRGEQSVQEQETHVKKSDGYEEDHTVIDRRYVYAMEHAVWPEVERPESQEGKPVLYPKLKPICGCESSYAGKWWDEPRQFENGEVLMNYSGNDDVGMCQINLTHNARKAKVLGYNLYTRGGNIRYANWLFERNGSAPWYESAHCWRHAFEPDGDLI